MSNFSLYDAREILANSTEKMINLIFLGLIWFIESVIITVMCIFFFNRGMPSALVAILSANWLNGLLQIISATICLCAFTFKTGELRMYQSSEIAKTGQKWSAEFFFTLALFTFVVIFRPDYPIPAALFCMGITFSLAIGIEIALWINRVIKNKSNWIGVIIGTVSASGAFYLIYKLITALLVHFHLIPLG